MVHVTDIYELKSKLYKLKIELDREWKSQSEKELANKYLNKVIDLVNELRLY